MNHFANVPPALIFFLGAALVPFLKPAWRSIYVIALTLIGLVSVSLLEPSSAWQYQGLSFTSDPVDFLRVDALSKAFGLIFALNAVAAFIYAFYYRKASQHTAALCYIGGAMGSVFAGDLLSLYVFWESMALSSTFVILSRNTELARGAAFRYLMVHLFGGLTLLAGVILTISHQGGSIAFNGFDFGADQHLGTWLILIGILVNCGALPLSSWLPDAYPAASVTGGLILSAYTTKTAVYTLLRGFPSWEPLIWIGCAMALYGVVYALIESDMRRVLAYAIINQVGFMICAAGLGTEEAINGATASAFCHILYKSLLWMATGAVLYRVGTSQLAELGGLARSMPLTAALCVIGALSMALPGTCGFTSKNMIIHAVEYEKQFWPWLILEISSVGIFLATAIRLPYFIFFGKDRGLRPKDARPSMLVAMILLGTLCLLFGIYPEPLYALLPFPVKYVAYSLPKVVIVLQWIVVAGLAFVLLKRFLEPKSGRLLDFDWFYRRGSVRFYQIADRSLNGTNRAVGSVFAEQLPQYLSNFFASGSARILCLLMTPIWQARGLTGDALTHERQAFFRRLKKGASPIGATVFFAVIILGMLSAILILE